MNTLQFIDAMTGRLAWPLTAVTLGLVYRRSLAQLLGRVRKLKWRETEAELAELVEASEEMQEALAEAAKPLPEDEEEGISVQRSRVERLMRDAAIWGFALSKGIPELKSPPEIEIEWTGDAPKLTAPDVINSGVKLSLPRLLFATAAYRTARPRK